MGSRSKIALVFAAAVGLALVVRSCNYHRYKDACDDIEVGASLADARESLEDAGGKWVARVVTPDGDEHQWLRVRFSFKHQNCAVTVDEADRVVRVRYSDVWDLL